VVDGRAAWAVGSGHFFIQKVSCYTYFGRGVGPFEDLLEIKVASMKNVIFFVIQYVRKFRREGPIWTCANLFSNLFYYCCSIALDRLQFSLILNSLLSSWLVKGTQD
jgi:hypothetical protein